MGTLLVDIFKHSEEYTNVRPIMSEPIGIVRELLIEAARRDCKPLLWKATADTPEPYSVAGDIDLVIDEEKFVDFDALATEYGFVRLRSSHWRTISYVLDYFGYCSLTGELVHLQVYSKLVLGRPAGPQLVVHNGASICYGAVGRPAHLNSRAYYAVLRICSAAFFSDIHTKYRKKYLEDGGNAFLKCSTAEIRVCATQLFGEEAAELVLEACFEHESAAINAVLAELKKSLMMSPSATYVSGRVVHKLSSVLAFINRKTLRSAYLPRREFNAPVVVVMGSDGSGKSTLSYSLGRIFEKKIDCRFIYFGTGDGPSSIHRKPLLLAHKFSRMLLLRSGLSSRSGGSSTLSKDASDGQRPQRKSGVFAQIAKDSLRAVWGISVAIERRSKYRKMLRFRKKGFLVFTDRFPQVTNPGIHDGARLDPWRNGSNRLKRRISNWEASIYESICKHPIDSVIFLDVDLPVAIQRRPEESTEELTRRIDAIREVQINTRRKKTIDAALPLDIVQSEAVKEVVETLSQHNRR